MTDAARVLVVDDDRAVRAALRVNLRKAGYDVVLVTTVEEAQVALAAQDVDLVLTDVRMPGATGLDLLDHIRTSRPELPVVVMTGYGSVSDAVDAMRRGASHYLIKPVGKEELLLVLERLLAQTRLLAEVDSLRRRVDERFAFENIVGASEPMQNLFQELAAVAETEATVLLTGPTGTGKELLAHAVHQRSNRRTGPYIRVNCTAIPETLIESELFGHEKGAFSGAIRQHRGRFEQADGGTILLDEIGEIDLHMQVKLLRVLQNGELQRVGGSGTIHVDTRVVAATNRDLAAEVQAGRFREDLYYRLAVLPLHVPALKDRAHDVPLLVEHFVQRYSERNQRSPGRITADNLRRLQAYDWPGNVRQLEHAVERAVVLHRGGDLVIEVPNTVSTPTSPRPPAAEPAGKPAAPAPSQPPLDGAAPAAPTLSEQTLDVLPAEGQTLNDALADYERAVIIAALEHCDGVQAAAARYLGLSRSNLAYRIKKLDIRLKRVEYE